MIDDRMRSAPTPTLPGSTELAEARITRGGGETRLPVAIFLITLLIFAGGGPALAGDWPQLGRDNSRNLLAAGEQNLPADADPAANKNIRWTAPLGSQSYGNVAVAGGRVFVGTNNAQPRDPKYAGDYGILLCLDEASGKFLWQLAVPKLAAGKVSDWEEVGFCSSPTIDGDRAYAVTNRCEVVCLSVAGQAAGNLGPFHDEAQYTAGPDKPPIPQGPTDADIIWRFDMRDELGVFPHNMTASSVLVVGDRLYVTTSNGVDWTGKHLPAPAAPALICLDKKTGKLLARERSGISARTFYCNWSSPAAAAINGQMEILFGGGDGFLYGFAAEPGPAESDGIGTLNEIWRCDCNPPSHRSKDGKPIPYGQPTGPSEVLATPVIVNNRVFICVGQEPEQGDGAGCLSCIDPTKSGDVSTTGVIWRDEKFSRSLSTAAVANGLLYLPDFAGVVHCFDANSGLEIWSHDTEGHIWGGALVADGKVYVGNENGSLIVLAAGREKKLLADIDFKDAIDSTPIAANGTVYVQTLTTLFAVGKPEAK